MTILYLLIPLGLILLGLAVAAFFWATKSGQFDDLETPAWSVVLDDDRAPPPRSDSGGSQGKTEAPATPDAATPNEATRSDQA